MGKTATCPVCGCVFERRGRQKYCSESCRKQSRSAVVAAWRLNKAAKDRERQQAAQAEKDRELRERLAMQRATNDAARKQAAASGDPLALMDEARTAGDQLAYWRAFRAYVLSNPWGERYFVNEIPVTSPTFAEDVIIAIAERGAQIISMGKARS